MAEVKKPPSFNHSSSSSYKHIYDDVFASPMQSRQQSSNFIDDDYAEMFGSSRSNNGTWSISYSSIPVLDLPPPSEMRVRGASGVTTVSGERGGNVDYSGVFGGVGDGNSGLLDGEELFDQFNKKSKTSSNAIPRSKVQTTEATRPEILRQFQSGQLPTNVFSQSIDSLHDFERKKNEVAMKNSGEIPKATHAHDFPGVTHKMEEPIPAQTTLSRKIPVIKDGTQLDMDAYTKKKQGKHDRHISMDIGANVQNDYSDFLKESGFRASNSLDTAHDTSQSATGSTNSFSQPSDSTKHFDHMNKKMRNTWTSEAVCAADAHVIHESTSTLHESDPTQLSNETYIIKDDTETKMDDVNMAGKHGKHSRNPSSELNASKHNSELHTGSQDTRQPNLEAGVSKTVGDDIAISFDVRRKKGRHSRITSLDLGDHKHSCERDGQLQRKPRFGGSHSFDASHDPHGARVKVQPSMMAPSSSVPQFFPVESHYKISENSSWRNFGADVYKGAAVPPPSLDEQLDMNSAAGISVAALQRAIEEAAMIIQMAKEYLEREGQGSGKVRFKDTLKVKVAKDEKLADEMDEFQQSMAHGNFPPADTTKQKLSFLKDTLKVKVVKDNKIAEEVDSFQQTVMHDICPPADSEKEILGLSERMSILDNKQPSLVSEDPKKDFKDVPVLQDQKKFAQDEGRLEETIMHDNSPRVDVEKERLSLSERISLLENGQPSSTADDRVKFVKDDPIFQDGKKFVQDEGCIEERNPNMHKLNDERDRQEAGGEWEAAKHLNQLICGVKNKIASFMAWQTDTEKEDPKKTEACRRSHLQSEEGEHDLIAVENTEMKTTEKNQDNTGSLDEHVEIEIGFLSETVEPCETESFWSSTAGQEKAESSVDSNPVVAASASANFMFFPFRNEGVNGPPDTNYKGNTGSEECAEIEFMIVREDVLNEMKYEQLQVQCEEQNREALDDTRINQDSIGQADQCRHVDSKIEETYELMEELQGKCEEQNREAMDDTCINQDSVGQADQYRHVDTKIEETYEIMEELQGKCEEQNREAMDDTCINQDSVGQADQYRHVDSNIKETNEIKEEPYFVAEKDKNGSTVEEDPSRSLDEECRRDPIHDSHCPESKAEIIDANGKCEEYKVTKETENWQHDAQIFEETGLEGEIGKCIEATEGTHGCQEIEKDLNQTNNNEEAADQMHEWNEYITNDTLTDLDGKIEEVAEKASFSDKGVFMKTGSSYSEVITEEMAKEASFITEAEDERSKTENEHIEDTAEQVAQQAACFATVEDHCQQNVFLSEAQRLCRNDDSSAGVEEAVSSDEMAEEASFITEAEAEAKRTKTETVEDHCQQTENVCLSEAERPCRNDDSSTGVEEAVSSDEMAEEASFITEAEDEHIKNENEHNEDTDEQVAQQAACFAKVEDSSQQTESTCLSEAEEPCRHDHSSAEVEEALSSDEKCHRTMEIPYPSSDPKLIKEETVLFYDSFSELDGITEDLDDKKTIQFEDFVLRNSQSYVYPGKEEIDVNVMESEFQDILENRTKHLHDSKETLNAGEVNTNSVQEVGKCGVDAVQRRRRWFDNGVKVGIAKRPSILDGGITEMESDQEALDESVQAGSVEINADELDSDRQEVIYSKHPSPAVNQDSGSVNSESTPKRRRWSVKIGEEGLPVPPPLFRDINVNLEDPQNTVNETLLHSKSEDSLDKLNVKSGESLNATEAGVAVSGGKDKNSVEAAPRRKRWFGSGENVGPDTQLRNDDVGITLGIDQESKVKGGIENHKHESMHTVQETEVEPCKVEPVNDRHLDEVNRKEKERIAVERAIREARERAFAEARERARRDASERSNVDARQKVEGGAQERVGKVPAEARASSDKASMDAKLRAERAAVERATSEARERALQKALSEKASHRSREQAGRFPAEKNTSSDPNFQSSSSFSRVDLSNKGEQYDGFDSVSAQRRKERLERRSRPMERPATALEEKNQRDLLVQKEQAAKNMMADSLDVEVKRWSTGKEGNLRVLLSTLQYILSPESGWQAVSLTDLVESTAVRKAYKKATLCVHPDKLQQRGATIQQKYICEKVFDLLKDAWSKVNPDEH